jgi:hypothetical protein
MVLAERIPAASGRIVAAAEELLEGRFDLLGYRGLSFGRPVDWHLDPVSGRRAPRVHWTRIDPLDADAVGDSKVIWELSRHQWLVRLGQAYRLTADERYSEAFAGHVLDWLQANPPGIGINWASSLEVSFRLMSWAWALQLFHESPAVTPELRDCLLQSLWQHATYVERYLSYHFSPNTHLTGEALGLFYAGVLLAGSPRASRWRQLGRHILEQEITRQILPDGVYFEQSTCYQRYTAEIYLHLLILAAQTDPEPGAMLKDRLSCLLDSLLVLLRPDGSMPQIGDADGGWLLPLDVRPADSAHGVFSTAAVLFRRADYAWAAGGLAPETLWLLGPSAAEIFDSLQPGPPRGAPSRLLAAGGYAVMRNRWATDADQVVVDLGPLGCPVSGGHGHADLLAVQCSFRGRPYVVDPGTFRYTTDQGWRAHFRGTAAHSTIEVDGSPQVTPRGPFAWDRHPSGRLLRWESRDDLDIVQAEHRAYDRLPDPVLHRRTVILVKSGYCVIVDDLDARGEHTIALRFQLAPMRVGIDPDQWVWAGEPDEAGLLIHAFASVPLKPSLAEGELEPRQGWVSTDYGVLAPAPMLAFSTVARLPLRILTLLLPSDRAATAPRVSPLVEAEGIQGLDLEERREKLWVSGPSPRLERD